MLRLKGLIMKLIIWNVVETLKVERCFLLISHVNDQNSWKCDASMVNACKIDLLLLDPNHEAFILAHCNHQLKY